MSYAVVNNNSHSLIFIYLTVLLIHSLIFLIFVVLNYLNV